ncbi:MAG: beta-galactosidase, partial [Victivallales bacterium]|nr:beta-galactosidase [Victivallales bacterium]
MPILPNYPHILHGGDWNPDQWLETPEIIDEDFRLMDLAHCNTFSVGIFSWGKLEVQEGVYDFAWLDDIMDRAAANGKKIFLATPTAARPSWLATKYPETADMDEHGVRRHYDSRQNCCYSSEILRAKAAAIDRALAQRYAKHPALAGWHINNEFSNVCYCPKCRDAFHDFLKRRYRTLEELNRQYWCGFWSHCFTDWNQVEPRDYAVNLAKLDWKRFITWFNCDFFQMEIQAVRTFSNAPVTTNQMGLWGEMNYWEVAKHCDFIADDCYPTWFPGITEEVAADFCKLHDMHYTMQDKPFLMMESCPGIPQYKKYMRMRRPNEFQREMLMALGHGADGTMYFQWRKNRGNLEQFHGAVVGHDGTSQARMFQTVADYGSHLDNLAETVDARRHQEVALVLDWEARWALSYADGYSGNEGKKTDQTINAHYRALWKHNVDIAVINQEQDFSRYKMVVAPMLFMLQPDTSEKMERYVENGGVLVLTYLSAYTDESTRAFFGGFPGGPRLRRLFGIWNEEA